MSISDKFIHDFYSTIDEYMDKFVSQQISKEEFLSAFEKHCEANKDTVSLEDFGELSRRGWTCSNEKYSDEDYKKLVSAFDEVMYMKPDVSRKAAEKALNDDNYQNPVRSRIFEGYSMFPTRTAQIAAKALYSIADNPRHEKVLIDFYNENQRKINETSIERYGWYDGHFNYEYGLAHEMQSLERETEYEEARVERVEKKGALAKKIEPTIDKSMHYENFGPVEELQFIVPTKNNPHAVGYIISGKTRVRDYLNIANQLAEAENKMQDFSYDEEALQKDLADYVKANDEADKMRWISYAVNNFIGNRNSIDNWYPEQEDIFGKYGQELIAAKEKGQSLDEVKTPSQRRPRLQRIFSKSISDLGLKLEIGSLNPEELAVAKELFKDGFPSRENLDATYKKYQDKANEIMAPFGYKKRQEMFDTLMKRYGKSLLEDRAVGYNRYFDSAPHFMSEKEHVAFDKMSLKEVCEKYSIEGMWTFKGAVMINEKISAAKDNPKKLAETLKQALEIMQQQRKCFHVPLATREFMLKIIEDAYHNMPQRKAEYGKFSAVNNEFRKIFATLKPQPDELKEVEELNKALRKDKSTTYKDLEFLQKRGDRLQKFASQIDAILDQKVDVSKVKSDLKQKLSSAQSENDDAGGVIAADRHAEAVQKAAESGIHFKGGKAEIDFQAYRDEVGAELKTKREKRHNDLDKKRSTRQGKQFQR